MPRIASALKFAIEPTENFYVVTRMIEIGKNQETQEPIYSASKICRETLPLAVNEVRASLDVFAKQQEQTSAHPPKK